jgi:phage anti-repressor protein
MTENLDIVSLIEKNPITNLNKDYNNKFLEKIKKTFTQTQQYLFVGSFYCYLNHDQTKDFVVNLRNIWEWIGFSRIEECKRVLTRHFIENIDYVYLEQGVIGKVYEEKDEGILAPPIGGKVPNKEKDGGILAPPIGGARTKEGKWGGSNKQHIFLNISTFKKLCMKSNTKKADEIHDYFIKLEQILLEIVNEESNELRAQLALKDEITDKKIKLKEDIVIEQFPEDTMCIYIAHIGIHNDEQIVKFGCSNNLKRRVNEHRRNFEIFELISAYKVANHTKLEKILKTHPEVKYRSRKIGNNVELLMVNSDFTVENLDSLVKELIKKHCSIEAMEQEYKLCELQEKTKQLQLGHEHNLEMKRLETQLEMKKIELELKKLETVSFPTKVPTDNVSQAKKESFKITDILQEFKGSKVKLLNILKKHPRNQDFRCNGYGHYNGFSKDFKAMIEEDINKKFNLSAIKNNGRIYYSGLRFVGHTSFYDEEVYQSFVKKYIKIPESNIKFEKIPPGEFRFKTEYETLQKLFYDYCKEITPLFESSCATGFSSLFKKEFIEMICKFCDVKSPSYSNKNIKYFNGITLKNN